MTFEEWKKACSKVLNKELGIGDMLDEDDPYDVQETMEEAFENEMTPEDWVREAFEEDYANKEYDAQLAAESEEAAAWEDGDEDDFEE